MNVNGKKKYGLILPSALKASTSASAASTIRTLNPLRDSDEDLQTSEEEDTMDWLQASLKKSGGGNSAQMAQQQRLMREALQEDATVFQYDEHLEEMEEKRRLAAKRKTIDRKPKYVDKLLKAAERRKLEGERRTERKVQAEREAEGDLYRDKESFVTQAYRDKLEELKRQEAIEKMEDLVDEKYDKTENKSKFYNTLLKQRLGETEALTSIEPKTEPIEPETEASASIEPKTEPVEPESVDAEESNSNVAIRRRNVNSKKNQYRKRVDDDEDQEDTVDVKLENTQDINDQSRKDSSSRNRRNNSDAEVNKSKKRSRKDSSSSSDSDSSVTSPQKKKSSESVDSKEGTEKSPAVPKETKEERIIRLFSKRTVGDKFVEAQKRYFLRKSQREL